jgi:hypothetical protein
VWQAVAKSQADAEKASGAIPGERTFSCGGGFTQAELKEVHQNAPVTRYDLNEAIVGLKKALHVEITELGIDLGQVEADLEVDDKRLTDVEADIRRTAFNSELQEFRHEVYDRLAALESAVTGMPPKSAGDHSSLTERLAAVERKLVGKYDATHMSKAYDSGYNRAKAEAEDAPPAACGFYDDQRPKPEGSILKQHEEFHRQSTPTPAASDSQTKQIGQVLEVAGGREALAKSLKYPAGKPAAPAPSVPACVGCKHTASKWNGDHFEDVEIRVNPGCPKHGKLQPAAPESRPAGWLTSDGFKPVDYKTEFTAAPAKRITAEQVKDMVADRNDGELDYLLDFDELAARINDFFGGK